MNEVYSSDYLKQITVRLMAADRVLHDCERIFEMDIRDRAALIVTISSLRRISPIQADAYLENYKRRCLRKRNFYLELCDYVTDQIFQETEIINLKRNHHEKETD